MAPAVVSAVANTTLNVVQTTLNNSIDPDNDAEFWVDDPNLDFLFLLLPFITIPTLIILVRLIRYSWRIAKAKKKGNENEVLKDPLAQLGFHSNANYAKMKQIKKARKELDEYKRITSIESDEQHAENEHTRDASASNEAGKKDFKSKADKYLTELRLNTRKTWSEKLSPAAVKRVMGTTRYGRIWMFFQVACTTVSIINYILLTYGIGNHNKKNVKRLDVALATVFLFDYLIGLYTADDRLRFYFNLNSQIDLLSIIPTYVYVFFVSDSSPQIGFLGLLRILRASRILRTYRLISFSETEERRELTILALTFVNFLFLSASIINAFEVIQVNAGIQKTPPSLQAWHDCLYYIMITFSTIGFGDLTPNSVLSRVLVMILVVLVIIFVPLQTGKLSELYNSTNQYQRARYIAGSSNAHVIMSGVISYSSIIDFCREYFENDPTGHVVILAVDTPNLVIRRLLRHPYYKNRVHYLCGSPLNTPDLKRCSASQATGIFLLNEENSGEFGAGEDEQLKVTRGADAEILMQALIVKGSYPGLAIFSEVQDIRSQDLSEHCGCDRSLCIDELKMTLLARNAIVPGILTLIMNLVHSYKESGEEFEEAWKREYHSGASHQMQTFRFPPALVNKPFSQVTHVLFASFGVNLFAIITRSNDFILNPGKNYIIKADDVAVAILTGGDSLLLRIAILFENPNLDLNAIPVMYDYKLVCKQVQKLSQTTPVDVTDVQVETLNEQVPMDSVLKSGIIKVESPHHGFAETSDDHPMRTVENSPSVVVPPEVANFQEHIILCGNMTARGIRHFIQTVRSSEKAIESPPIPIVCLLENIPNTLEGIWEDVVRYPKVYLVQGTPLKKTNLVNVGIARCHRIMIFAKQMEGQIGKKSVNSIPDANSIFIVQMIQEEWPHTTFVVELVNGSNAIYFSIKDQQINLSNLKMKSILNNHSLTISDRVALYKKVRHNTNEQFFGRMFSLFTGTEAKPGMTGGADQMGAGNAIDSVQPSSSKKDGKSKNQYVALTEETDGAPPTNAYLQKLEQEAELNESGLSPFPVYHFDKHFAAGMIATSSFTHSLLCQSYFRPFLIKMVKLMMILIIQKPVPAGFAGRKYVELMAYFLENDYVVIGLYRRQARKEETPMREQFGRFLHESENKYPYMYTNPKWNDTVNKEDYVFVLPKTTRTLN